MINYEELANTMEYMLQDGKGILAADESNGTIAKRFTANGIENTAENRCDYRLLLATTPGLNEYINGVILFEETFDNLNEQGISVPSLFIEQGIMPGIKVDKGLIDLPNTEGEKVWMV